MTEVISAHGWDTMRWEPLDRLRAHWRMKIIDASALTRQEVADEVLDWARGVLDGRELSVRIPPP